KPAPNTWRGSLGKPSETAMLAYDPASGATSGQWFFRGSVPGGSAPFDSYLGVDGPADQRVEGRTAARFCSSPLASDTTLLGGGTLRLRVTPQMPQAEIAARVVDEPPVGSSTFSAGYGTLLP